MLFMAMMMSCSTRNTRQESCVSASECQELFGLGYTCVLDGEDEGFCDQVEPISRCTYTTPKGVFDWENEERLLIGAIFESTYDLPIIKAVDLATDQINAAGGVADKTISVVHCDVRDDEQGDFDGKSSIEAIKDAAIFLSDELQIPVIIGPPTSDGSKIAYEQTKDRPTVLISPSATSPTLTNMDGLTKTDENPGTFWRTVGPDDFQAALLAHHLVEDERTKVIIFYEDGTYGDAFDTQLQNNLTIEASSVNYANMNDLIGGEIDLSGYDGIVLIDGDLDDITTFIQFLFTTDNDEDGYRQWDGDCDDGQNTVSPETCEENLPGSGLSKKLYLTDGAAVGDLLTDLLAQEYELDDIERISGTRPGVLRTSVNYTKFQDQYDVYVGEYEGSEEDKETYAQAKASGETYVSYAYDATWVAVCGAAWAEYRGVPYDGYEVARGLRRLSELSMDESNLLPGEWAGIEGVLAEETGALNVSGASGPLDFDPTTEELDSPIDIWKIGSSTTPYCFDVQQTCVGCDETLEDCAANSGFTCTEQPSQCE